MSTDKIIILIDKHLQEVDADPEKRIKRIEDILDFLNYNLRLTKLSNEEKEDFVNSMEGYPLTDEMLKTLKLCKNKQEEDHYITMWARSNYFRQCFWLEYLKGKSDTKPILMTS
jgi:hypothetical protein